MDGNRNLKILWVIPLVCLMALASLTASAQGLGGEEPTVAVAEHGGSVSFSPRASFDRMTLTVAGQDSVFEQSFKSGQTASFAPVDQEGYALPDGTYKWEIVASRRLEGVKALKDGEPSPDGRTVEAAPATRGPRQSGVFTIKGGAIVDSSLVEPESSRAKASLTPEVAGPPSAAARNAEHTDRDDS